MLFFSLELDCPLEEILPEHTQTIYCVSWVLKQYTVSLSVGDVVSQQTEIGQFARLSGYTQHLSLGWTVQYSVDVGVCPRLRNVAVNPFCSFLCFLPRYQDVAKL